MSKTMTARRLSFMRHSWDAPISLRRCWPRGRRSNTGPARQLPPAFRRPEGQTDVVALLLNKEAAPDLKNNEGHTPLALAVQRGRAGVIQIFIKTGLLDPNPRWPAKSSSLAAAGLQDVVDLYWKKAPISALRFRREDDDS